MMQGDSLAHVKILALDVLQFNYAFSLWLLKGCQGTGRSTG